MILCQEGETCLTLNGFNKVKALCVLLLPPNSLCHKGEINGLWKRTGYRECLIHQATWDSGWVKAGSISCDSLPPQWPCVSVCACVRVCQRDAKKHKQVRKKCVWVCAQLSSCDYVSFMQQCICVCICACVSSWNLWAYDWTWNVMRHIWAADPTLSTAPLQRL